MIEPILVAFVTGAAGAAAGKATEYALRSNDDEDTVDDDDSPDCASQFEAIVDQIGQNADSAMMILIALHGLTIEYDGSTKEFEWKDASKVFDNE